MTLNLSLRLVSVPNLNPEASELESVVVQDRPSIVEWIMGKSGYVKIEWPTADGSSCNGGNIDEQAPAQRIVQKESLERC